MAAGKRPVPFRTRKLSPPAPMVLPPGGSGRVGYRRPNNFTQTPAVSTTLTAGAFSYALAEPTWLDSALRTTLETPTMGAYPPIPRPGQPSHCGTTGATPPGGRRAVKWGPHRSRGAARAATMTPTVGRKSSTGRRVPPRTPMNSTSSTRPTTHPQQPGAGPHSALRTTPDAPTMGANPPTL